MKILIVEDNMAWADLLVIRLGKAITAAMGADVRIKLDVDIRVAESLGDGLDKSVEWSPDATLLDPTLPDSQDWRESILAIKNDWRGKGHFHPPVWIITEMEKTPEVIRACMDAGALEVFYKPWDMDFVERIVSDIATKLMIKRSEKKHSNGP